MCLSHNIKNLLLKAPIFVSKNPSKYEYIVACTYQNCSGDQVLHSVGFHLTSFMPFPRKTTQPFQRLFQFTKETTSANHVHSPSHRFYYSSTFRYFFLVSFLLALNFLLFSISFCIFLLIP